MAVCQRNLYCATIDDVRHLSFKQKPKLTFPRWIAALILEKIRLQLGRRNVCVLRLNGTRDDHKYQARAKPTSERR